MADSISFFPSGATSVFLVMEEADFQKLPTLFSGAMALVAPVPPSIDPQPDGRRGLLAWQALLARARPWSRSSYLWVQSCSPLKQVAGSTLHTVAFQRAKESVFQEEENDAYHRRG